jgi:L,D-transpeptidase-like protein
MSKPVLSRRDFLKLSGCGLMGMLCPKMPMQFLQRDDFDNLQNRVIERTIWGYDEPDFKAKRLKLYSHNDFGRPRSHSCINLTPQAAKWLFRWTISSVPPDKELIYGYVGTKVEIKI